MDLHVRPSSGAEFLAHTRLHHAIWGARLSLGQYLAREEILQATEFSRAGRRAWSLVSGEEGGGEALLASCESFEGPCLWTLGDGRVEEGLSHAIASVFVPDALRGKGLASSLMSGVQERLRALGAVASTLYSDVGAGLYERAGWRSHLGTVASLPVAPAIAGAVTPTPAEPLFDADLAAIETELCARRHDALGRATTPAFAELPTAARLRWHHARATFLCATLGHPAPRYLGARAGQSHCTWMHDPKSDALRTLTWQVEGPGEAVTLLDECRTEAARSGLERVVLWDLDPLSAQATGLEPTPRTDSLPMLHPFTPGLQGAQWLGANRFGWV